MYCPSIREKKKTKQNRNVGILKTVKTLLMFKLFHKLDRIFSLDAQFNSIHYLEIEQPKKNMAS